MWTTDGHLLGVQSFRWCICMMTSKRTQPVDARIARKYGEKMLHDGRMNKFTADELLQVLLDLDHNCFCARSWPLICTHLRSTAVRNHHIDVDLADAMQVVPQNGGTDTHDLQHSLAESPGSPTKKDAAT